MKIKPIESSHIRMMDEVVRFLQERGWDVISVNVERYKARDFGEPEEKWKQDDWKWHLTISTSPRDDGDVKERENASS